MLLRMLFNLHRLMDEASELPTGGTGGGGELNVDIDKVSDQIGAELGLGGDDEDKGAGTDDDDLGSATPPGEKKAALAPQDDAAKLAREKAVAATEKAKKVTEARTALKAKNTPDLDKKTDDEVLALVAPVAKAAPKSWPKERHEIYSKLPPEAQAFIDQREAEVEEGFKQYGAAANYAKGIKDAMQPYEALLTSQGVKDHTLAVRAVMNAHYVLSTAPVEDRAKFFADLAKNYQVDMTKAMAAYGAQTPAESDEAKALRVRLDKIESEKANERSQLHESFKTQAATEVAAFAADPKNAYFSEVASEVALFMADPNISLAQAYGMAVYANPVTREKELARIKTEAAEASRLESEEKAKAAAKARGTRVRGEEKERASPDLLGSMEDTMRTTYKEITTRQD